MQLNNIVGVFLGVNPPRQRGHAVYQKFICLFIYLILFVFFL